MGRDRLLESLRTPSLKTTFRRALSWNELKEHCKGHAWLHVSAHGFLDDSKALGLDARLRTAPIGVGGNSEDLSAYKAFNECFPGIHTSVVFLSSCHAGKVLSVADEPIGVPTALLLGCAKVVVAPLWETDEVVALLFSRFFYEKATRVIEHRRCSYRGAV